MRDKSVAANYDVIASAYADHLYHELDGKPLDRHLLNRFAEEVSGRRMVADIGCGPGHIARYLSDRGVSMTGIDVSPEMVRIASERCPDIQFRVGNMTALDVPDASLAGIVAFYSIIHLEPADLPLAFREFKRTLADDGLLLVAFHIGDHTHHADELWEHAVSLDFRFLNPAAVKSAMQAAGFVVTEAVEREPYAGAEHASRRCYLLARPESA